MKRFNLRQETPADHREVKRLVCAFWKAVVLPYAGVGLLIRKLRPSPVLVPVPVARRRTVRGRGCRRR